MKANLIENIDKLIKATIDISGNRTNTHLQIRNIRVILKGVKIK